MTNILLISEDYVKTNSNLNDNVWGDYLLPAIREAEDIGLQSILGSCLYNKILSLVDNNTIADSGNTAYKILLDEYIQEYLLYQVITDLIPIIGSKLANLGTVISNDEHVLNLGEAERNRLATYYSYRAGFYAKRLQEYLLNNRTALPELKECDCERLRANLHSSANIGVWLGGYRGRKLN